MIHSSSSVAWTSELAGYNRFLCLGFRHRRFLSSTRGLAAGSGLLLLVALSKVQENSNFGINVR